jgi:hypothetical protein
VDRAPDRGGCDVAIRRPSALECGQSRQGVDREPGDHLRLRLPLDLPRLEEYGSHEGLEHLGGDVALHAAALDDRIDGASCAGFFGPREGVWQEPLDRNVFGLLRDFGAAEIASMVAPRPLVLHHALYPEHEV